MPPKKKRKSKSTDEEPTEPLDYVTYVREKCGRRFASTGGRKNVNYDIEQNIRETRALLKINSEIFGRCMASAKDYDDGRSAIFTRFGFDVVKVCQNNDGTHTQFTTESERSQRTFDLKILSELPTSLNGIFSIKYQDSPFNNFIDYGAFFQSAILLHDEVLEPFLAKLKGHIESIHVALGKVETWLLENNSNLEFLETNFSTKLKIPNADQYDQDCSCPEGTHASSDKCSGCPYPYSDHNIDYYGGGGRRCPVGVGFFKCKKVHMLKSSEESGKFEKTFSIAKKSDQTKLKKFLEFIAS